MLKNSEKTNNFHEPMFEVASNPLINLKELKNAMKTGTVSNVKITDTVSGKITTVGKMFNGMMDNLERMEIIPKKNTYFGDMLLHIKKLIMSKI